MPWDLPTVNKLKAKVHVAPREIEEGSSVGESDLATVISSTCPGTKQQHKAMKSGSTATKPTPVFQPQHLKNVSASKSTSGGGTANKSCEKSRLLEGRIAALREKIQLLEQLASFDTPCEEDMELLRAFTLELKEAEAAAAVQEVAKAGITDRVQQMKAQLRRVLSGEEEGDAAMLAAEIKRMLQSASADHGPTVPPAAAVKGATKAAAGKERSTVTEATIQNSTKRSASAISVDVVSASWGGVKGSAGGSGEQNKFKKVKTDVSSTKVIPLPCAKETKVVTPTITSSTSIS